MNRKTRVEKDGSVPPLRQLKLQSEEVIEWAFNLREEFSIKEIREKIKERTGIELRWDSSYTAFCQWYMWQQEMNEAAEMVEECMEWASDKEMWLKREAIRDATMMAMLQRAKERKDEALILKIVAELRKADALHTERHKVILARQKFEYHKLKLTDKGAAAVAKEISAAPPERREKLKKMMQETMAYLYDGKEPVTPYEQESCFYWEDNPIPGEFPTPEGPSVNSTN